MIKVIKAEIAAPINARRGLYVSVEASNTRNPFATLSEVGQREANFAARLHGFDPKGASSTGVPVSHQFGTRVTQAFWFFDRLKTV